MSLSNTETRRKRGEDDTETDRIVIGRTTGENHSIDLEKCLDLALRKGKAVGQTKPTETKKRSKNAERDGASRIRHIAEQTERPPDGRQQVLYYPSAR